MNKRERRAAHEYTKSLNKPGRVGTFAESERDRREDERQERKAERKQSTEYVPVKLPGAALLITIGLFLLWLAATGNLKKLGQAWDFVRGKTQNLPGSSSVGSDPVSGILDFSQLHVGSMMSQPITSASAPGGMH